MATVADARLRLDAARAYLDVAEVVLDEARAPFPGVAAGLAVLAGIAASDAICARRLGEIHRGADHREAASLLRGATPDGARLTNALRKLLDVKDEAHYGLVLVERGKGRRGRAVALSFRERRPRRGVGYTQNVPTLM